MDDQEFIQALKDNDINMPFEDILEFLIQNSWTCHSCGNMFLMGYDKFSLNCSNCQ
jgi:hypothetical protein